MASNSLKKFRYYLKSQLLWVRVPIKSGHLKGYWWSLFTGIRFLRGDYHLNETEEMIRLINPDDVVYDVGAHIGYYSLIASRKVAEHYSADRRIGGHVFAFEPLPVNLKALQFHVNANKIENITIVPYAVSSESGQSTFDIAAGGTGRGRLNSSGNIRVITITLDSWVFKQNNPPPNFIKIDVEGGEVDVLKGASELLKRYSPKIFLATHGEEIREECETFLRAQGYIVKPFRNSDIIAEKPRLEQ